MPPTLRRTLTTLSQLRPASRDEMIVSFVSILGERLMRVIDTHNTQSVIFVFACDASEYVLKAEYGSDTATNREIGWYRRLRAGLDIAPALHYTFENDLLSFLVLMYLPDSRTLDDIYLDAAEGSPQVAPFMLDALKKDRGLYEANEKFRLSAEEVNAYYGLKYRRRRDEAMSFPFLAHLFHLNTLVLNGKPVRSIDYYVRRIQTERRLYRYLTPHEGGTIHGDLHFGNILQFGEGSFLIDPNGGHKMPFEYDLGKILHSVHGNFGGIMRRRYRVSNCKGEYVLEVDKPAESEACIQILKRLLDTQTFLRGLYSEAMHFATMLPHHATEKDETTALFLTCVQLFSELFEYLDMPATSPVLERQHV